MPAKRLIDGPDRVVLDRNTVDVRRQPAPVQHAFRHAHIDDGGMGKELLAKIQEQIERAGPSRDYNVGFGLAVLLLQVGRYGLNVTAASKIRIVEKFRSDI